MSKRPRVEISGEYFDGPVFQQAAGFLEQQHSESVGFFSGGTAGAPDAQAAEWKFGLGLQECSESRSGAGHQVAPDCEEAGFSDGDLIEQSDQFGLTKRDEQ